MTPLCVMSLCYRGVLCNAAGDSILHCRPVMFDLISFFHCRFSLPRVIYWDKWLRDPFVVWCNAESRLSIYLFYLFIVKFKLASVSDCRRFFIFLCFWNECACRLVFVYFFYISAWRIDSVDSYITVNIVWNWNEVFFIFFNLLNSNVTDLQRWQSAE